MSTAQAKPDIRGHKAFAAILAILGLILLARGGYILLTGEHTLSPRRGPPVEIQGLQASLYGGFHLCTGLVMFGLAPYLLNGSKRLSLWLAGVPAVVGLVCWVTSLVM